MRVAMRRMRSILGVFHRAFPCAEFVQFRQEAKLIAAALADARDWDVFIDLVAKGPLAAFPNDAGLPLLLLDAEKHRETGYKPPAPRWRRRQPAASFCRSKPSSPGMGGAMDHPAKTCRA
jgi:inorganic triphosphatase YgiF